MRVFNNRGFTFLEVLVVLVVIGILSMVWFSKMGNREDTAKIQATADAMAKIAEAVEEWRLRQGQVNYGGLSMVNLINSGVVSTSFVKENPFGKNPSLPAGRQGYNVGATAGGVGYWVVAAANELNPSNGGCGSACTQAVARNLCNRGFLTTCYSNTGIIGYSVNTACAWGTRIVCN